MDPLRRRFAALPTGRLKVLVALVAIAAAVVVGAAVLAAGQAAGSAAELPAARPSAVATAEPAPTPVLVHVSGAVRRPGIVALPAGARVLDAVAGAGGTTAEADEAGVNLAARVVDGQQVVVPERGAAPRPAAAPGAAGGTPLSLATATAEQLEGLPRIGPAMAARIIAYRDAHGFASVQDLGEVSGVGPKTLEGLRDLVVP